MNTPFSAMPTRAITCAKHGEQSEFYVAALDRWMGCNQCAKAVISAEDAAREADALQHRRDQLNALIGLPDAFARHSLKTFAPVGNKQNRVVSRLIAYAANDMQNPRTAKNIILMGATGGGKTHLACGTLRYAAYNFRHAKYSTSAHIINAVRDTWGKKELSESAVLERFAEQDLLLIDEVGQRDESSNAQEILSQLIDMRYKRAPTLITTNLTEDKLRERLGDRAYDRLAENLILIQCDWGSYRQAQAAKNREEF